MNRNLISWRRVRRLVCALSACAPSVACEVERFGALADAGDPAGEDGVALPSGSSPIGTPETDDTTSLETVEDAGANSATDAAAPNGPVQTPGGPGSTAGEGAGVEAGVETWEEAGAANPPPNTSDLADAALPESPSGSGPADAAASELDAAAHEPGAPPLPSEFDASQPDAALEPAPDPSDECPEHPEQKVAGACGCGFATDEHCLELGEALLHRYSFDGSGTLALDSVGEAHAELTGAELSELGTVELSGQDAFVGLPADIATSTPNATFEVWLVWHGGEDWQRIFDFGNRTGAPLSPQTYLYLTPCSGSATGARALMVAYSLDGSGQTVHLHADEPLPTQELVHVAVVVNGAEDQLSLYLNGTQVESSEFEPSLSDIEDSVHRLGRSMFTGDPDLDAELYEYRIYGRALDEALLAKSFELGPDAPLRAD